MNNRLDSIALERFLAVAEALSFREAAQALHTSQPPLSRAIRQLEDRLGVRLFERDTRHVSLTAAGKSLLPYARRMKALLAQAEAAVAHTDAPAVFRLGLTSAVEPAWFSGIAARLGARLGGVPVSCLSAASPELVRLLRRHRLQAAFIALPTDTQGLEVTVIEHADMMVALCSGHALARRRTITLAQLQDETVFWFERARQPAFHDHCQRVFDRHGFAPRLVREPDDHHVLLAEVANGNGIALLPRSFSTLKRKGVVYRTLAEGGELAVGIGLALPADRSAWRDALLECAAPAPRKSPARSRRPTKVG